MELSNDRFAPLANQKGTKSSNSTPTLYIGDAQSRQKTNNKSFCLPLQDDTPPRTSLEWLWYSPTSVFDDQGSLFETVEVPTRRRVSFNGSRSGQSPWTYYQTRSRVSSPDSPSPQRMSLAPSLNRAGHGTILRPSIHPIKRFSSDEMVIPPPVPPLLLYRSMSRFSSRLSLAGHIDFGDGGEEDEDNCFVESELATPRASRWRKRFFPQNRSRPHSCSLSELALTSPSPQPPSRPGSFYAPSDLARLRYRRKTLNLDPLSK